MQNTIDLKHEAKRYNRVPRLQFLERRQSIAGRAGLKTVFLAN
jgi:hypothetical protein